MVLEHSGLAFEAIDGLAPAGRRTPGDARIRASKYPSWWTMGSSSSTRHTSSPIWSTATPSNQCIPPTRPCASPHSPGNDSPTRYSTRSRTMSRMAASGLRPAPCRPACWRRRARTSRPSTTTSSARSPIATCWCGALSIADLALFPHLTAVRFLDLSFDGATHPRVLAWYKRLRRLDVCRADLERTQVFLRNAGASLQRPAHIVWRGDRIEWILARGFHDWFFGELRAGRVAWPRA